MSNFVNTCNLLGQYMKQKGSLRDLNLEIGGEIESLETIVKPVSSSPAMNKGKSTEQQPSMAPEDASYKSTSKDGAKMTIFYGDRVLIFDDYPPEKAKELVALAKKGSSKMSYAFSSNTLQAKLNSGGGAASSSTAPPRAQSPSAAASVAVASTSRAEERVSPPPEASGLDLPIARRSSLHRFLGKRKDRTAARGPNQIQEHPASSSKTDEELELKL